MAQSLLMVRRRWRQKMVKEEKIAIKNELDQVVQKDGLEAKFKYIIKQIK